MSDNAALPDGRPLRWKDQDYPTVYSNLMGIGMTPFDVTVLFGEIGDSGDKEVIGVPRMKLVLSPEQAANLCKLLAITLTNYVQTNGPLRTAGAIDIEEITRVMQSQLVQKP